MPWNFQHVFNIPWNIQHSFEHALQFSTCAEILNTQHALQFSEHSEIFNMLFYSFQNILKFQHAFLQFSEHTEISTCFFIVFNTLFQYAFNMHYRFQHALKFSTHVIYSVPQIWKLRPRVKSNIIKIIYIRPSAHQPMDTTKSVLIGHILSQLISWFINHWNQLISLSFLQGLIHEVHMLD